MRYTFGGSSSLDSWTTPVVRRILWANGVVFLVALFTRNLPMWEYLVLSPGILLQHGALWMAFTYMYVHFDLMHLLTNLLGLWMFGPDVERIYGGRRFFYYYTACGIGAAIVACVAYPTSQILGASGAIYGILLAFAILFPYRPVYLFGVAPIEARWLAVLYGVIDLVGGIQGGGGVAHLAHLGGFGMGLLIHFFAGKFRFSIVKTPSLFARLENSRPSFWKRLLSAFHQAFKRPPEPEKKELSDEELNAILDKIAKNGMNSLTRQERERLKEASTSFRK